RRRGTVTRSGSAKEKRRRVGYILPTIFCIPVQEGYRTFRSHPEITLPMFHRIPFVIACCLPALGWAAPSTNVQDYASIQEAIDGNPGRLLFVPAGDYAISEAIRIKTADSGLWGPGRIVQG